MADSVTPWGVCRLRCFVQIERLNQYHFLSAKPVIYLVNMKKKSYLKKGGKSYVVAPPPGGLGHSPRLHTPLSRVCRASVLHAPPPPPPHASCGMP